MVHFDNIYTSTLYIMEFLVSGQIFSSPTFRIFEMVNIVQRFHLNAVGRTARQRRWRRKQTSVLLCVLFYVYIYFCDSVAAVVLVTGYNAIGEAQCTRHSQCADTIQRNADCPNESPALLHSPSRYILYSIAKILHANAYLDHFSCWKTPWKTEHLAIAIRSLDSFCTRETLLWWLLARFFCLFVWYCLSVADRIFPVWIQRDFCKFIVPFVDFGLIFCCCFLVCLRLCTWSTRACAFHNCVRCVAFELAVIFS